MDRRRFLRASAATGAVWVAPAIVDSVTAPAYAAGASMLPPTFSTGGDILWIDPPASIGPDELTSNSTMHGFVEAGPVTLASNLDVDADCDDAGTTVNGNRAAGIGSVPSGITVYSYFVHAEKVAPAGGRIILTGSFTVGAGYEIVGLVYEEATLEDSDLLENSSVDYPSYDGASNQDRVTLSNDKSTVTIRMHVTNERNHVRVIVAATT